MLDISKIIKDAPEGLRKTASSGTLPTVDVSHPETQERIKGAIRSAYMQGRNDQLQKTAQREAALDQLHADVVAASCAHTLLMAKVAMKDGLCWECRAVPFSPRSAYRRCLSCDAMNQD